MSANSEKHFNLNENKYVWKEVGGSVVVLQFETGAYWTLNETGSAIWKLILDRKSKSEIIAKVCVKFEVETATAETDYDEMINFCIEKEMLEMD